MFHFVSARPREGDDVPTLPTTALPAIAQRRDGEYMVILQYIDDQAVVYDPVKSARTRLDQAGLAAIWSGRLILLKPQLGLAAHDLDGDGSQWVDEADGTGMWIAAQPGGDLYVWDPRPDGAVVNHMETASGDVYSIMVELADGGRLSYERGWDAAAAVERVGAGGESFTDTLAAQDARHQDFVAIVTAGSNNYNLVGA
ncbi:MAG: hypothetical protein HY778_12345 [Betaproteobacteria bacterium]|nr:hypothetical protein [Betaproteobacteria bacterium]